MNAAILHTSHCHGFFLFHSFFDFLRNYVEFVLIGDQSKTSAVVKFSVNHTDVIHVQNRSFCA